MVADTSRDGNPATRPAAEAGQRSARFQPGARVKLRATGQIGRVISCAKHSVYVEVDSEDGQRYVWWLDEVEEAGK